MDIIVNVVIYEFERAKVHYLPIYKLERNYE